MVSLLHSRQMFIYIAHSSRSRARQCMMLPLVRRVCSPLTSEKFVPAIYSTADLLGLSHKLREEILLRHPMAILAPLR
jgi:hypothetical protein